MSLAEQRETQQASKPEGSSEAMMAVDDMDEEMARAIAMSMEQDVEMAEAPAVAIVEPSATASEASKAAPPSGEAVAEALNDPQFLDELLSELQVDKDAVDVDVMWLNCFGSLSVRVFSRVWEKRKRRIKIPKIILVPRSKSFTYFA
jgi:hypothetical protein